MSFCDTNINFTPLPGPGREKPEAASVVKQVSDKRNKHREFVTGDQHFFDPNIMLYNSRPFDTVGEMNTYMVNQWNSVVEDDDTVFVLGDFFDFHHCDRKEAYAILDQLKGNIVLIKGNHDDHLQYFYDYGIQVIEYPIIKDEFWFLSHEPMFVTETAPCANIFAHVHLNPMYKTASSRSFCVSVERHDYKPVLLSEAKRLIHKEAVLSNELRPSDSISILDNQS
jgi:calcineurin-like phosphoesterase family protein